MGGEIKKRDLTEKRDQKGDKKTLSTVCPRLERDQNGRVSKDDGDCDICSQTYLLSGNFY